MNKRGAEDLLAAVMWISLVLVATGFILIWINDSSSGKLIQSQVDAKQAALAVDIARPGTDILFQNNLTFSGNNITSTENSISFTYSHFNPSVSYGKNEVKING